MECLARKIIWDGECCPNQKIGYISLCTNPCNTDQYLCEICQKEKREPLTDPPPKVSKIFGSPFFIKMLEHIDEKSVSKEWFQKANQAQKEAEKRCKSRGVKPWTIEDGFKLVDALQNSSMPPKKKNMEESKATSKAQSMMKKFTTLQKMYIEEATQPEQKETDEEDICKEMIDDKEYWVTKTTKLVFTIGDDGEPDELVGCLENGCIIDLENDHV